MQLARSSFSLQRVVDPTARHSAPTAPDSSWRLMMAQRAFGVPTIQKRLWYFRGTRKAYCAPNSAPIRVLLSPRLQTARLVCGDWTVRLNPSYREDIRDECGRPRSVTTVAES